MTSRVVVVLAALSLLAGACGTRKADRDTAAARRRRPQRPGSDAGGGIAGLGGQRPRGSGRRQHASRIGDGFRRRGIHALRERRDEVCRGGGNRPGGGVGPRIIGEPGEVGCRTGANRLEARRVEDRRPGRPGPRWSAGTGAARWARDTSPVIIGSIGTLSGPAGDTIRRTYEGGRCGRRP